MNKNSSSYPEGVVLPNLDDRSVIEELLRLHAMAVSQRLAEAAHKNVQKEEVIQADRRAAALLASTLLGKNPAYTKSKQDTVEMISKNLRNAMGPYLALYEIQELEVKGEQSFFQFAMFAYTNEVHELINDLKTDPDSIERDGPVKLSELIKKWADFIAGDQGNGSKTSS